MEQFDASSLFNVNSFDESNSFIGDMEHTNINNAFQNRIISSIPLINPRGEQGVKGKYNTMGNEQNYESDNRNPSSSSNIDKSDNSGASSLYSQSHPFNTERKFLHPDTVDSLVNSLKNLVQSMDIPPLPVFIPPNSDDVNIKKEIDSIFPYSNDNNNKFTDDDYRKNNKKPKLTS